MNQLEEYDNSIQYNIANAIVTVFGKEAVITYDMIPFISDDSCSDDSRGSRDVGGLTMDRKVVKQSRKWELSNGKWLQTI